MKFLDAAKACQNKRAEKGFQSAMKAAISASCFVSRWRSGLVIARLTAVKNESRFGPSLSPSSLSSSRRPRSPRDSSSNHRAEPPFAIPQRNGDITDFNAGAENPPRQIVVFIQDLHANVGVQKNIAAILYRLLRTNKIPSLLVCVEGASGEGDVSLLRSLPGFIRHGFEAMLLHKAYLTGAELAATEAAADWPQQQNVLMDRVMSWFRPNRQVGPVSLSPILLWGVDDPDLYRKNWRAAKYVDREHYEALQELKATRADAEPPAPKGRSRSTWIFW